MKEQKWVQEGLITEPLSYSILQICLDKKDLVLDYVLGKIQRSFFQLEHSFHFIGIHGKISK